MGDGRRRRLGCFGLLVDLWGLGWRRRTGQLQLLPSFSSSDNALSAIPPPKCSKLSPSPFTVCMQLPYEQTHVLMPALLSAPNCSQIGVILPLYAKRQRWEQPAHPGLLIPPLLPSPSPLQKLLPLCPHRREYFRTELRPWQGSTPPQQGWLCVGGHREQSAGARPAWCSAYRAACEMLKLCNALGLRALSPSGGKRI